MDQNALSAEHGLSAADLTILEQLRVRLGPLVYNLSQLEAEMLRDLEQPPSWPLIQRYTSLVKSHVKSFQEYINGPISHDGDMVFRDGKPVTVANILETLTPYPATPFPLAAKYGLVKTLIGKGREPYEENWVDESAMAAADFCRMPDDWDVPPRKVQNAQPDAADEKAIKRVQTQLGEDEVHNLWQMAGRTVGEQYMLFDKAVKGTEDQDEEEPSEEELERLQKIREELGITDETPGTTPEPTENLHTQQSPPAEQFPLPLGLLHQFMSTGVVNVGSGARM